MWLSKLSLLSIVIPKISNSYFTGKVESVVILTNN